MGSFSASLSIGRISSGFPSPKPSPIKGKLIFLVGFFLANLINSLTSDLSNSTFLPDVCSLYACGLPPTLILAVSGALPFTASVMTSLFFGEVAKLLLNSHVIETKKTYMPQNRWEYTIHRPISYYTKSMIIDYIKEHNADELLTETISCYKQKKEPCKQCPSCLEKMDLLGHY